MFWGGGDFGTVGEQERRCKIVADLFYSHALNIINVGRTVLFMQADVDTIEKAEHIQLP